MSDEKISGEAAALAAPLLDDAPPGGGEAPFADEEPPPFPVSDPETPLAVEEGLENESGAPPESSKIAPYSPGTVRVVSPMTLGSGYRFVAMLSDGRAFQVTVPEGGVQKGQTFSVPYPTEFLATTVIPPTGGWKDNLCDCFSRGLCHPSLCLALWFAWIANSQVLTRMKLNWLGQPAIDEREVLRSCPTTLVVLVAVIVVTSALNGVGGATDSKALPAIANAINLALFILVLYVITMTRMAVRRKYNIPEQTCHGCEDCCCAYFCTCCTVGQMMRHTADYETYPGLCFTNTGLPPDAPIV